METIVPGAQASPSAALPICDLTGKQAGEDACAPSMRFLGVAETVEKLRGNYFLLLMQNRVF